MLRDEAESGTTRRQALVALAAAGITGLRSPAARAAMPPQSAAAIEEGAAGFTWTALQAQRAASGKPWLEFLRTHGLFCGTYVLAAGATDAQQPHATDEVYWVVRGKARFATGDGATAHDFTATPGALLFVAAGVAHRFHAIEEELELLVFFTTRLAPATRAQVDDLLRRYETAYNAGDAKALAAVYTEDGLFQPPGGAAVRGRAAIEEHWKGRMGRGLVLRHDAFDSDGGAGFAAGTWELDGQQGAKHGGRFVVGMRRGPDGLWRMSFDTYHDAPT